MGARRGSTGSKSTFARAVKALHTRVRGGDEVLEDPLTDLEVADLDSNDKGDEERILVLSKLSKNEGLGRGLRV